MNIIWQLKEATVHEVLAELPKSRDLAYTSVSTILRILEQKEVLKTRKEGRGHTYIPRLSKGEFESQTVKHLVERVFDNTPVALVRNLLGTVKINEAELQELRALLEKLEPRK